MYFIFLSKKSLSGPEYHSLVDRIGRADSSSSDGRFVFGNGLAQGPEDPQAAVAVGRMGRMVAEGMPVVAVVRCRRQRGGRLLRPGPSAVLRSRH